MNSVKINKLHNNEIENEIIQGRLEQFKTKFRRIAVYGYGTVGKIAVQYFGAQVTVVVDMNWNKIEAPFPVYSPEELSKFEFDAVVITVINREIEIATFLMHQVKIPAKKIYFLTWVKDHLEEDLDEWVVIPDLYSNKEAGICTQEQLESPVYREWLRKFGENLESMHRKQWEFAFIAEALDTRGMLQVGKRGLGFAVGTEPLTSIFCSKGVEICATDLDHEKAQEKGWVDTNQHANNLKALNGRHLCDTDIFEKLCQFENVDMNDIPAHLRDFDFLWSSCALEHLGSIALGEQYIYESLKCLKPGGIAVHTTEYNYSSNDETIDNDWTVLFRKQDIERIANNLRAEGHEVVDMNFTTGTLPYDKIVDLPPYRSYNHLKLLLGEYVITSIGIIIKKKMG